MFEKRVMIVAGVIAAVFLLMVITRGKGMAFYGCRRFGLAYV